ncbi:MAG: SDR family oxidoreductase [Bacteroidia bacterium]|nr:SDR family oxidoreductase [Bacteroidia bacterium]
MCGSTQGIGRAAAMEIAQLGANVTLIARNEPRLKTVQEVLDTSQGQAHDYIIADFNEPYLLREKVLRYCQNHKLMEAHILVNNTGGPAAGPIYNAEVEEFKQAYDQHLISNHLLVQTLVPLMKNAAYGRIINVISTSVKEPLDNLGVSNTTRWAVAAWAKTLAGELGPYQITVNNVLPGYTRTARLEGLIEKQVTTTGRAVEDVEKTLIKNIPLGRFAQAEEIGAAIAFLSSPAASYINGVNLVVDGGRTHSL